MEFAFLGGQPTAEQIAIADGMGINLTPIGEADVFTVTQGLIDDAGAFEGVIVTHPAAAMQLAHRFIIGVFNGNAELVTWDLRD